MPTENPFALSLRPVAAGVPEDSQFRLARDRKAEALEGGSGRAKVAAIEHSG